MIVSVCFTGSTEDHDIPCASYKVHREDKAIYFYDDARQVVAYANLDNVTHFHVLPDEPPPAPEDTSETKVLTTV